MVYGISDRVELDRIDHPKGKFLGNRGDSFPMRSMYPDKALGQYAEPIRTNVPLPDNMRVRFGEIAPAFEQSGGGMQYVFEEFNENTGVFDMASLGFLLGKNYLRKV
ncbi:TNT domain-containing protein [Corynebacterium mastitidis]|uniref:TNT domain-containing protein n=1 Tax=Corynebacterium mastitidis TaxID=161890 RepID=UPI00146132B1|nr:TNT domain-containing protein [Corynebacterium mastitidis]